MFNFYQAQPSSPFHKCLQLHQIPRCSAVPLLVSRVWFKNEIKAWYIIDIDKIFKMWGLYFSCDLYLLLCRYQQSIKRHQAGPMWRFNDGDSVSTGSFLSVEKPTAMTPVSKGGFRGKDKGEEVKMTIPDTPPPFRRWEYIYKISAKINNNAIIGF